MTKTTDFFQLQTVRHIHTEQYEHASLGMDSRQWGQHCLYVSLPPPTGGWWKRVKQKPAFNLKQLARSYDPPVPGHLPKGPSTPQGYLPAHPCLPQHCSSQPSYGNSPGVWHQMNGWNVVHIHTGVLFSHKEKIKYVLARKPTEPETVILSKVSQTQTDKYCLFCHTQNMGVIHTTPHLTHTTPHTHHESGRELLGRSRYRSGRRWELGKDGEARERERYTQCDYKTHALNKYKIMETSSANKCPQHCFLFGSHIKKWVIQSQVRTWADNSERWRKAGPGPHSLPGTCFSASQTGFHQHF